MLDLKDKLWGDILFLTIFGIFLLILIGQMVLYHYGIHSHYHHGIEIDTMGLWWRFHLIRGGQLKLLEKPVKDLSSNDGGN